MHPSQRRSAGARARRRQLARILAILVFDCGASAASLVAAEWLRFEGPPPARFASALPVLVPLVAGCRLVANLAARLHRWSFRLAGLPEAVRVLAATLAGTTLFAAVAAWVAPGALPRSVFVIDLLLATAALGGGRFAPRAFFRWQAGRLRRRAGAARTIIVGSGVAAELLARDLQRSTGAPYDLVGFVEDEGALRGGRLDGKPILGHVRDLPEVVRRHGASVVLLAETHHDPGRIREILDLCQRCRVRFKIIPAALAEADERRAAAMLDDVSAEDLLQRPPVDFDDADLRALVRGRRALVTGAGGSIGGELCRQLAHHGVSQLVMVDMNENELYLRARWLADEHPGLDVRAEVADVREGAPLLRLGARYRPQDVFHAAAHKHVPLMEVAPGEAVKNNVFGTRNVARMAQACGAERFVLISTDKAVKPSSVMGATKRVAELLVRDLGRASPGTRMTAVRFGNVLGSAGSVVPIFRRQIARGGPVTVTHQECTRFFMTVPEAVNLVLAAGLGGYGELCVLDMGDPVRIADLARHMITLAGRVPGEDVPIVYTGLRPGEKLFEEVLTEEEERTHAVRKRIRVAASPPPRPDLAERLDALERAAHAGNRAEILEALRDLVPTYRAPNTAAEAPRPFETPAEAPLPFGAPGPTPDGRPAARNGVARGAPTSAVPPRALASSSSD
ncbi:nucleoside-diphosphate sugar epimerase/dehydratase [Anaeromyxobacter oryzisoli]|uniref:nucleoside-diphosphate sugar epimerase/dehydratase n=1 Tax=Anaeromyxobacter oryzisoli TaxID=2925408 RepID=UPI001F5A0B10|nr:nucleoside-diphosphate sugar epimerase/dehydratase [Anaeromyxobacter sp. SG63]